MSKPLILVTNDDGIYSNGIYSLHEALSEVGETIVVAPDAERSGVGHGITISDPIRINNFGNKDGFCGYAVSGTPADCIKIAFNVILKRKPDIVVSGINRGANIGLSVLYSGTVSAAAESVIQGVPAIAISLDDCLSPDYSYSCKVAKKIVEIVLAKGILPKTVLNINVPKTPNGKAKGFRITRQGTSNFVEEFDKRTDPKGNYYYWMDGEFSPKGNNPNIDDVAIRSGYVSVTPLHCDLTSYSSISHLEKWKELENDIE